MSHVINGQLVSTSSIEQRSQVIDPSTGAVVETVPQAGPAEVDAAVDAASAAFEQWSRATPADRSGALTRFAQVLDDRAEEFAELESRQAGKPIRLTREFDVPGTVDNTAFFAGAARNLEGKATAEYSGDHTSSIRREPVGVIGSISPWNYPLQMAAWKIPIISEMPHGGMKESGFGKDMSSYSFDEYTVVKHVMYDRTGIARKDWHRTVFAGEWGA